MVTEEKRKHPRINSLNLSYVCVDENNNIVKQGIGRTLNVSESGILLETHFSIDPKHLLFLTIGLEENLVDIKGKVAHIKESGKDVSEVGIEFLEIDAQALQTLRDYIKAFKKHHTS
jgi:hypothetical protein